MTSQVTRQQMSTVLTLTWLPWHYDGSAHNLLMSWWSKADPDQVMNPSQMGCCSTPKEYGGFPDLDQDVEGGNGIQLCRDADVHPHHQS